MGDFDKIELTQEEKKKLIDQFVSNTWFMKEDLKEIISNYLEGNDFEKPLMIVATSKYINSNAIVDECRHWMAEKYKTFHTMGHPYKQGGKRIVINGQVELLADHPELLNSVVVPQGADDAQIFVYYRYDEQLKEDHLDYIVALSKKMQKPAICLINDYAYVKENGDQLNLSAFDLIIYDGKR